MSGVYYAVQLGADKNPARGVILAEAPGDGIVIPPSIKALWRPGEVSICWRIDQPMRTLSPESLAKMRRTRLHNRLQRDVPMFADQIEERELAKRPDFFSGKRP